MKIKDLSKVLDVFNRGSSELITGITNNSKLVKEGFLFVAVKGTNVDGHIYVEDAVSKGASALILQNREIAEKIKNKYPEVAIFLSDNTRKAQALVAKIFYSNPDEKLRVIGITGTNGKTTTANLIYQYLLLAGKEAGIIGTINYRYKETVFGEGRTTPDSTEWFKLLKEMKDMGAEYVVAEISSHALDQYRVYGTKFEGAVFTNLTQDHLDYHSDMESYFEAKQKLFEYVSKSKGAIAINIDDGFGNRIYSMFQNKTKTISYGKNASYFKIGKISFSLKGTEFELFLNGKKYKVKTKLLGLFNVYNTVAALSLLYGLGFDINFLVENAKNLNPVKGRFEIVYTGKFLVINDYAHTPDALEKVLSSLRELEHNKIITVFGAGGNRDKEKRPLMGNVAEKYSDKIIITSDNPRMEEPLKIIEDIKKGIKIKKAEVVPDRKEAIKKAIYLAQEGDIVLIAGKGHETYQIVRNKILHFDDTQVAKSFLKERGLLC